MSTPRTSSERSAVTLFLDESGTSRDDPITMVGATAFHDVGLAEQKIKETFDRVRGDASLWTDPEKRRRFGEVGFHFTEDSESVRSALLGSLGSIEFRAYAAYAKNDADIPTTDLLVGMYGTLLSSVLLRYRDFDVTLVFEQNTAMDPLYSKMWSVLKSSIGGLESATAYRGDKSAPCLAATDYVLGVTRVHLEGRALDFQELRFTALGRNFAYLIDFDDDRHLGGTKHPIL